MPGEEFTEFVFTVAVQVESDEQALAYMGDEQVVHALERAVFQGVGPAVEVHAEAGGLTRSDALVMLTGSGADAYEALANHYGCEDDEIDAARED